MTIEEAYSQLIDKLQGWLETAVNMLPNLVVAILVVIIFYAIGKALRRAVNRVLHKTTHNKTIIDLLETVVSSAILAVGIFIALGILNLSGAVTSLLAGAGIIGLALGFAFQDIAANFISGVFLTIRHPFGKGDIIESQDHYGTVQKINLRCTIIKTPQGQIVYLPNKDVFGQDLVNFSKNHERRIDLACGVSYGDDLEKAKKLAIEAVEGLEGIDKNREVEFIYDEFGGSSINFKIRFWVNFNNNMDYLEPRSDAIMAIKKKFDENDIMIPFPIRTLDFGIRGGEKLDTMLRKRSSESNGESKSHDSDTAGD